MQSLLQSEDVTNSELQKLHFACKEWGFFQLINHGVSISLLERVKLGIKDFFDLPMEEKNKFGQEPGDVEGYGQAFVTSEEQKLDWADMFYMVMRPKNLRKPQYFPKLPTPIREALDEYSAELEALGHKILAQMAKALGMKFEDISVLFEQGFQSMRLNYYPPCPQPELVIGLCSHSDPVGITILLQISEIEGLQIKKDGAWVPVVPLPNAFIVNVGDILEIMSNEMYKSIEHRATVSLDKERLSIATFIFPKLEMDFGPAPSLISPEYPAKFRSISMIEYLKGLYSRELEGKSYRDAMKI